MNISVLKKMRRDLCKTVGHSYIKGLCSRCKKRDPEAVFVLGAAYYVGTMPIRKDVDVIPAGTLTFNIDINGFEMWDGSHWIVFSQ